MTLNRRQFLVRSGTGLAVVVVAFDEAGCPTVQQWFQIAEGLIPIAIQTVGGLTLGPLGLPAADLAFLNSFSQAAVTLLQDIAADVKLVTTSNTAPIPTIDSLIQQLKTQTAGVLAALHITNPNSLKSVTNWIMSILADVVDIANLVPVFQQGGATAKVHVIRMKTSLPAASALQSVFQQRLAAVQALNG